jgi:hypothetical protein
MKKTPSKQRLLFTVRHGVTSEEIELFIDEVTTSNNTQETTSEKKKRTGPMYNPYHHQT